MDNNVENSEMRGFYSQSQSITKIATAILKAQKAIGAAKKDSVNPFFKSKYADLGSVMEVCKDPLNENGIAILQPIVSNGIGIYVLTTLLHESGEFISSQLKISAKHENDPQAQGSAITYARRYALQSLLSIPAEDDDANGAMGRGKDEIPQKSAPPETPKWAKPILTPSGTSTKTFIPRAVLPREKSPKSGKLGPFKIVSPENEYFGTFDGVGYTIAEGAMKKGIPVIVEYVKSAFGQGFDIKNIGLPAEDYEVRPSPLEEPF